ncbi:unnamed protein product, partial [Closterium sp. NIES-54]
EMVGWEYSLHMAQEPHLFVLRKQKRDGPDRTTPVAAYYILDGSIYQAPSLHAVIGSRICRALHHLRAAFSMTRVALDNPEAARPKEERSDSEGASVDAPDTPAASEAKPTAADVREMARLDHVIMSVVRKLTPAPPPPDIALPALPQPVAAGEAATAEDKTGGAGTPAAGAASAGGGAASAAAPATGAGATTGAGKKAGTGKASTARKGGAAKARAGSGAKAGAAGKSGGAAAGANAGAGAGGGGGAAAVGGGTKTTKAVPKPTQEGEVRKAKKTRKV